MMPDVAPEDGVHPLLQFEPPHVSVATPRALYFPSSHAVHGPPLGPLVPASHAQDVLPVQVGAYVPPPHFKHTEAEEATDVEEYVPPLHSTQDVAPSISEYLPASHLMHLAAEEAPTVVEFALGARHAVCGCALSLHVFARNTVTAGGHTVKTR